MLVIDILLVVSNLLVPSTNCDMREYVDRLRLRQEDRDYPRRNILPPRQHLHQCQHRLDRKSVCRERVSY